MNGHRDLSAKYQLPVFADEVYHFLNFKPDPPPPLMAYNRRGESNIYSLGSFTKIMGPGKFRGNRFSLLTDPVGLRLGWIHTKDKSFHNWFAKQGEIVAGI